MTTREADKAIKAASLVTVKDAYGNIFQITLTTRNRRTVDGIYKTEDGRTHDGRFERADLQIIT